MPIINVQMWAGRSDEVNEQFMKALTDATVEVLNIEAETVTVLINEIEKEH